MLLHMNSQTVTVLLVYLFGYKMWFSLSVKYPKYVNELCAIQPLYRLLYLPKQSQILDPSYKMDLDFWVVLDGKNLHLIVEEI